MNPHLVILDEIHAYTHTHQDTYQTLQTGSGFRDQPLILTTTTAGDENSHIWAKEHGYAVGIAKGDIIDETVFSACFEIDEKDDALDPEVWPKANPSMLAGVLKKSYLENQAKIAAQSASDLNVFTRYHCNRLVASLSRAFDMDDLDPCFGALSDWADADAVGGGIDLGSRDDLAAFSLVARFIDGQMDDQPIYRYEARAWSYIAGNCKRDLTEQPWPEWISQGLLKVETHPIEALVGELIRHATELNADSVAYDPYQAQYLAETLELAGVECASMAQNCAHFNQPIIDLRALAADGKLCIDDNPLVRWCFGNAIAVTNRQNQVMLAKRESKDKIDPAVCILMALRRAMLAPSRAVGPLACF
jgi:phage terminase large subunit-like protein